MPSLAVPLDAPEYCTKSMDFTNYPSIGGSVSVHTVDRASYVVPSGTIEKPVQRQAVAQPHSPLAPAEGC
jgi:hypothetical protein